MEDDVIRILTSGPITELVVNRPKELNALNPDLLQSFILTMEKLLKSSELRVVIITGAGDKAFVAGADIKTMAHLGQRAIADYIELGQRAMRVIETARVPVIAAVNGYALGGGLELALACDLIVASKIAKFGQPEVNLGIIPGFGGTQRLIQRCGIGTARRLCYTGDLISADEAFQLGVVDKVVEPEAIMTESRNIAQSILKKAPLAIEQVKSVIRRSQEQSLVPGLRMEVESFLTLFPTVDREEGMNAFLQKREPKYIGK